MEGDAGPLCHGILQRARILHTLRGVQDFDPDDVAVIVDDDTGLILITFLNRSTAQLNQNVLTVLLTKLLDEVVILARPIFC